MNVQWNTLWIGQGISDICQWYLSCTMHHSQYVISNVSYPDWCYFSIFLISPCTMNRKGIYCKKYPLMSWEEYSVKCLPLHSLFCIILKKWLNEGRITLLFNSKVSVDITFITTTWMIWLLYTYQYLLSRHQAMPWTNWHTLNRCWNVVSAKIVSFTSCDQ